MACSEQSCNNDLAHDVSKRFMTAFVVCTVQTECESILTCEGAEDPEAPADLVEDVVPDAAPALKAALRHIQDVVPPEHPSRSPCCVSDPQQISLLQSSSAAIWQSLVAWLLRRISGEAELIQQHKPYHADLCCVEAQSAITKELQGISTTYHVNMK